ncbi:chemotaxis protein CheX [Lachnospira multipara]|jgi:CheY-specific phosphatase CheX|uniref:chemotaxis protein CheX n=1 Tax=Lachnospira multipara TaxID=28051 RepID=UPI0004896EDD|nr:chemotaxis protein CheX [Lachnospira multipara]
MNDKILGKYIAKNHSGASFTDSELQVIKQGNIDDMVTTFFDMNNDYYITQLQCAIKSLATFMDTQIVMESIEYIKQYQGQFMGCQIMDGDIDVFLGIAGNDDELVELASVFAGEDFTELDMDAYDALCELINVMNGAYATKLSGSEIEVTLHPPVFYKDTCVTSETGLYVAAFEMNKKTFKLLMAANDKIKLNA